jgi:PAN domain
MRAGLTVVALAYAALLGWSAAAAAQTGYDRRGGDYHKFTIKNGDPDVCAARCDRESRCHAWSFSYPGTEDQVATCWLKSGVPARSEDTCCVSGVKGSGVIEPQKGPVEYSIDRTGGDYRTVEVARDATGAPCKAACEADNRCRAWTYVRPGYAGPAARCSLKDKIPRPRPKPCCISGVVR